MLTAGSQPPFRGARLVVVMGVAGCGKSTVGAELGHQIGAVYLDGDTFHPKSNIGKMEANVPLEDDDRWPWLDRIGSEMAGHGGQLIVGCSALKRAYRDRLRCACGEDITFIHLTASREVIADRMSERTGHFMPLGLLDNQFDVLEPPMADERAISVDIDKPVSAIVGEIIERMGDEEDE